MIAIPDSAIRSLRAGRADRVGVVASTLCAVHCLATALFVGVAGAGAFFADERIEVGFSLCAVAFALVALVRGSLRHRSWIPAAIGATGIALLLIARCADLDGAAVEAAVSIAGGGALVTAHLLNIRALRRAGTCCGACDDP